MRYIWKGYEAIAAIPMRQSCTMMKTSAVTSSPPWSAGSAKASPMKPPSGSISAVIMGISSPCETLRK